MTEVLAEAEHRRESGDDLFLHLRGRRSTVEGMVIRVYQHGCRIAEYRGGMRRLEHLPDVARMPEGVVVLQSLGELRERRGECRVADDEGGVLVEVTEGVLPGADRGYALGQPLLKVGHDSQ